MSFSLPFFIYRFKLIWRPRRDSNAQPSGPKDKTLGTYESQSLVMAEILLFTTAPIH